MVNKIEVSINEEMQNVANAIKKVTKAAFAGSPGVAGTIKGKRKSAQFTLKLNKGKAEGAAKRQILGRIFKDRAVEVEIAIKKALQAVIAGLVGQGNQNIKVFGRSLGRAKPQRDLVNEPFVKFIKSNAGAGEIGLPDPDESIRNLQIALLAAITVDVVVREQGPQVKFGFDQRKLLKMTPHPDRLEGSSNAPFFSWLSLVTGPDFVSGTPGFALIRVRDLRATLRNAGGNETGRSPSGNLRRANIVEGLIRSSRTRGNAGDLAGIMLSTRSKRGGKSPAKAFGGSAGVGDYSPNPRFNGFWDKWWINSKLDLGTWTRRVMRATMRELLNEGK